MKNLKKMLPLIIIILILLPLLLFRGKTVVAAEASSSSFGKFVILEKYTFDNHGLKQYILYDPDTMVMYTFIKSIWANGGGGLSVMPNPDGTPRVYSPEN